MIKWFFALNLISLQVFSATYNVDVPHTAINFKIAHVMVSKVNGRFDKFEGVIQYDEKANKLSKVDVKIDLDSINTNNTDRDDHLRSPDFFAVRNEKKEIVEDKRWMKFEMSEVKMSGKKFKTVSGKLTLNGVTKPVTMNVDFKGAATDPWGNEKIVYTATGKINRQDFKISWNKPLDKVKGMTVGDEVEFTIDGEANKAKEEAPVKDAAPAKEATPAKK